MKFAKIDQVISEEKLFNNIMILYMYIAHNLFSKKNKKNITNLLSTKSAQKTH